MRNKSVILGFLLLLLILNACSPSTPTPQSKTTTDIPDVPRNVVLIVLDALRADQLDRKNGDIPLMPQLSALAERACRFTQTTTQATWTKPSIASLLTGLCPEVHNVQLGIARRVFGGQHHTADKLPDAMVTMAEFLKAAGFQTAAIQTNVNLKPVFGFEQGFDDYAFTTAMKMPATKLTDAAIEKIHQLQQNPFFLYLHYMDVHAPYESPEKYKSMLGCNIDQLSTQDKELLQQYNDYYLDKTLFEIGIKPNREKPDFSDTGKAYLRLRYDAASRYLDDEVFRLIAAIREICPGTLIVITADHGEELWEHKSVGHAKTVYDELTQVPLIISYPKLPPALHTEPAQITDILPTVAAYLQIPPLSFWQGTDLLKNTLDPQRPVYSQTRSSLGESKVNLVMIRKGGFKLIRNRNNNTDTLYDLTQDPKEQTPITDKPEQTATLQKLLDDFLTSCKTNTMAESQQRPQEEIDEKTLETLNSQGYF